MTESEVLKNKIAELEESLAKLAKKNDISFIISFEMNLWEHQSSFNPNMPMRFFLYAGRLYEKYIATSEYYTYSSSLQPIPRPKCVCFYNGRQEQPEERVLTLSDAYGGEGDIEVRVSMRNINYGKNQQMMEACKPLAEYAWLVETIRQKQKELTDLDAAVDAALDEMSDDFEIKGFLLGNRAEVKNMFLTEYNEEKVLEQERKEGRKEGKKEGISETNARVAKDMLADGLMPVSYIARISRLPEETVRKLAQAMGVTVL